MFWETITKIVEESKGSFSVIYDEDRRLEELLTDASSIEQYLAVKYNQCVLLDRRLLHSQNYRSQSDGVQDTPRSIDLNEATTAKQLFVTRLNELNSCVTSGLCKEGSLKELAYYSIGLLNFKAQNYELALKLFDNSIKHEVNTSTNRDNVATRLKKYVLKAYCLEYIALSDKKNTSVKGFGMKDAISFIVGYNALDNANEDDISTVIDNTMKCADNTNNLSILLDILYDPSKESLYKRFVECHKSELLSDNEYNHYISEIAHVLAHCLSEIRIEGSYKQLHKRHALFLRLADCLMTNLGDEYATCRATLKAENNEYFSALSILRCAKESICATQSKLPVEDELRLKYEKQIAQIDFYWWYFSVFARKKDGHRSKQAFYDYCVKTNDTIANTYYAILNTKEALIDSFEKIKAGLSICKEDVDRLREAYNALMEQALYPAIDKKISDECTLLKDSHNVIEICCRIFGQDNDDSADLNQYLLYSLYCELFSIYNTSCKLKDYTTNRPTANRQIAYYVIELACKAKLHFCGDIIKAKEALRSKNINVSLLRYKACKDAESLFDTFSDSLKQDTANIIISINNLDVDMDLINSVLQFDDGWDPIDTHNLFIDTSGLSLEQRNEFHSLLNGIKNRYSRPAFICETDCLTEAVLLSSVFAMLEWHLRRLGSPINSFVISPVDDDVSFGTQACDEIDFVLDDGFFKTQPIDIPNWKIGFGTSFSNSQSRVIRGKAIHAKDIEKYQNQINRILLFSKESEWGSVCYSFDVSLTAIAGVSVLCSDGIEIDAYDKANENGNDIYTAIKNLYRSCKESDRKKVHEASLCTRKTCWSSFPNLDTRNNRNYDILRKYLFTYTGILLPTSVSIFIRYINDDDCMWLVCELSNGMTPKEQRDICRALSNPSSYVKSIEDCEDDSIDTDDFVDLLNLEQKIQPYRQVKKYFFISYRGKGKTKALCLPVYHNVLKLQEKLNGVLEFVIDVANFQDKFNRDIDKYICDDNCKGSILFISFDYLCPFMTGADGNEVLTDPKEDKCLKEANLLIAERDKKGENFFIYLVFIPTESQRRHGAGNTLIELVNYAFKTYVKATCTERIECYKNLFGINNSDYLRPLQSIGAIWSDWCEDAASYFEKGNLCSFLRNRIEGDNL